MVFVPSSVTEPGVVANRRPSSVALDPNVLSKSVTTFPANVHPAKRRRTADLPEDVARTRAAEQ